MPNHCWSADQYPITAGLLLLNSTFSTDTMTPTMHCCSIRTGGRWSLWPQWFITVILLLFNQPMKSFLFNLNQKDAIFFHLDESEWDSACDQYAVIGCLVWSFDPYSPCLASLFYLENITSININVGLGHSLIFDPSACWFGLPCLSYHVALFSLCITQHCVNLLHHSNRKLNIYWVKKKNKVFHQLDY